MAAEVSEHPEHAAVRRRLGELRDGGERLGLMMPVLAEFVHIVTDVRRFTMPLTMDEALVKARMWWDAAEVDRIAPDDEAVNWFIEVMAKHRLGRKRVLDTMLAAIYRSAGITSLLTLNAADFSVFGEFVCLGGK